MKKNNIYKKRVKILESAKKHVPFDGWNERIFKKSRSLNFGVTKSVLNTKQNKHAQRKNHTYQT